MTERPTWEEVRRATEVILLRDLALDLERLACIGVKAVTIIARLPQDSDPLGVGFSIGIARSQELTDLQADLLVAAAAAHNGGVQQFIAKMEGGRCVVGPSKYLHAGDFSGADERFAETARRLVEPEGAQSHDGEAGLHGRSAPDSSQL